jgi:hypothetical protein
MFFVIKAELDYGGTGFKPVAQFTRWDSAAEWIESTGCTRSEDLDDVWDDRSGLYYTILSTNELTNTEKNPAPLAPI